MQGGNILIVGVSAGVPVLAVIVIVLILLGTGIVIFIRRRKPNNFEGDCVAMEDNAAYTTTRISTEDNEYDSDLNPNFTKTGLKTTANEIYGTNTCPMTDNQAYGVKRETNTSQHDHTDTADQMYATISEERVCVCQEQDYDYVPCTNAMS